MTLELSRIANALERIADALETKARPRPIAAGTITIPFIDDQLERIEDMPLRDALADWVRYKAQRNERYKEVGFKKLITRVIKLADEHGAERLTESIDRAIANGWKGFDHGIGEPGGAVGPKTFEQQKLENTGAAYRSFLDE